MTKDEPISELSPEFILSTAFEKQIERGAEEKLNKDHFFDRIEKLLRSNNITPEFLDELIAFKKKHYHKQFYYFNDVIKNIVEQNKGIGYFDILMMLEERWCDIIHARNCLDDSNEYELRFELSSRHGKQIKKQLFQRFNEFVF